MVRPAKIFILTAVLSIPVFAQLETPNDKPLIAGPNPALAGIKELSVVITTPDSEPNVEGLVWANLKNKVIGQLYDAGFKVSRSPAGHILTIPELRINIGMLKLESCAVCVLSAQTSLARSVVLPGDEQTYIGADVWKVDSGVQAVATEKAADEVGSIVQQQLQVFITACPAAGAGDKQPSQVKPAKPAVPVQPTKAAPLPNRDDTEQRFVASKNSKVFHKPGCPSAQRILPENLVTYSTRAEAIAAGKRPCKRCNP